MQLSLRRRQSIVQKIDFDKFRNFSNKGLQLGDIGNTLLDTVTGRIGINLNKALAPVKTYVLNKENHILIDMFKSK